MVGHGLGMSFSRKLSEQGSRLGLFGVWGWMCGHGPGRAFNLQLYRDKVKVFEILYWRLTIERKSTSKNSWGNWSFNSQFAISWWENGRWLLRIFIFHSKTQCFSWYFWSHKRMICYLLLAGIDRDEIDCQKLMRKLKVATSNFDIIERNLKGDFHNVQYIQEKNLLMSYEIYILSWE